MNCVYTRLHLWLRFSATRDPPPGVSDPLRGRDDDVHCPCLDGFQPGSSTWVGRVEPEPAQAIIERPHPASGSGCIGFEHEGVGDRPGVAGLNPVGSVLRLMQSLAGTEAEDVLASGIATREVYLAYVHGAADIEAFQFRLRNARRRIDMIDLFAFDL